MSSTTTKNKAKFLEQRTTIRKIKPLVFWGFCEFESCLCIDSLNVLLKVHLPLTLQGLLSSNGNNRAKNWHQVGSWCVNKVKEKGITIEYASCCSWGQWTLLNISRKQRDIKSLLPLPYRYGLSIEKQKKMNRDMYFLRVITKDIASIS